MSTSGNLCRLRMQKYCGGDQGENRAANRLRTGGFAVQKLEVEGEGSGVTEARASGGVRTSFCSRLTTSSFLKKKNCHGELLHDGRVALLAMDLELYGPQLSSKPSNLGWMVRSRLDNACCSSAKICTDCAPSSKDSHVRFIYRRAEIYLSR
jgi:hypothetical protein